MADRMDRWLELIGGVDALPPKFTPPPAEAPRPRTPNTDYDSEEYRNLPHPNTWHAFGDLEATLPKVIQTGRMASQALNSGTKVPLDNHKGQALPPETHLAPFVAVTKYCYKFVPKEWLQPLATAFFDQDKIYARPWDLYYITTAEHGLHTFVPVTQLQDLLDEINAAFPDANIAIDEWQRENGFVLDFTELPRHLQPRFLGHCTSRAAYASWVEQLQREPIMVISTKPTGDLRSVEAFKAILDAADTMNKAKVKAKRAKNHAKTLLTRQGIVRQAIRGQQYFGLRPMSEDDSVLSEVPAAIDSSRPVPWAFDQEPILIAIDMEAFERQPHMITEVGLATLDTRDLKGVAPGENAKNWHKFIRGRHMRILEWKEYKNSKYVQGCPDAFEFGTSEVVSKESVASLLERCFEEPYSGPRNTEHEFPPLGGESTTTRGDSSGHRNIIIVGHDLKQDVQYCDDIGFNIYDRPNIIDSLDTMPLFQQYTREPNGRSLGNILAHFDLAGWFLHNAGNDAMYTMQALLAICVQAAAEQGTDTEARKIEENIKRNVASAIETAVERAKNDADGWDLKDGDLAVPDPEDLEERAGLGTCLYTIGGAPLDV